MLLEPLQPARITPDKRFYWLIVAGVAAAGVERVDLLAGAGAFVLTPFVLIAPLLAVTAFAHWVKLGADPKPTYMRVAGWLVFGLACVLLGSLVFSETTRSVPRYVLLVGLVCGAWALITLVRRTKDYAALRSGAWLGLALYVGFDVVQWAIFQGWVTAPAGNLINLQVSAYGEGVVRLGGGSIDPNRAAVAVATYTYILIGDPLTSRIRNAMGASFVLVLGACLALATISRSGLMVFGLALIGALWAILRRQSVAQRFGMFAAFVATVIWVYASGLIEKLNVTAIAEARLSMSEGSAESHFSLFDQGWSVIGAVPLGFFTGTGYGSSFSYLQDVFPGNEYANFHSMYLTLLVEGGILALLLMVTLLVRPVFQPRRWLAVGVICFGVFYQGLSDPIFWMQVAMLWVLPVGDGLTPIDARPSKKPKEIKLSPAHERLRAKLAAG